jgi:hypothetical protein
MLFSSVILLIRPGSLSPVWGVSARGRGRMWGDSTEGEHGANIVYTFM